MVAKKKGRDGSQSGPLFCGGLRRNTPYLVGRSYPFIAERYTLYVHEDVYAKMKSCTST